MRKRKHSGKKVDGRGEEEEDDEGRPCSFICNKLLFISSVNLHTNFLEHHTFHSVSWLILELSASEGR